MDLHIKTKFEVGQEVYHIESSRKVVECEKTCELCFGAGSFIYKDYKCNCPKCGGHGKIIVDRKMFKLIQWMVFSGKLHQLKLP